MPQPTHVTFVHGIGKQPTVEQLRRIWLDALARETNEDDGFSLVDSGITTSFVYWSDLFYEQPAATAQYESTLEDFGSQDEPLEPELEDDPWIARLRDRYPGEVGLAGQEQQVGTTADGYERTPAPIFRGLLTVFLRQVHAYLFHDPSKREIHDRVSGQLDEVEEGARHVIVAHSLGSVIAYDYLARPGAPKVDGLLTLGSPLGIAEVRDELPWTSDNGFPSAVRGNWINVFDKADPVPLPRRELRADFRREGRELVIDVDQQSWGMNRHAAEKYLAGTKLRRHLRALCGREDD